MWQADVLVLCTTAVATITAITAIRTSTAAWYADHPGQVRYIETVDERMDGRNCDDVRDTHHSSLAGKHRQLLELPGCRVALSHLDL
jgi:hypothetical protein